MFGCLWTRYLREILLLWKNYEMIQIYVWQLLSKKCTLLDCNILEIVYTSQTEYILKILILMKYVIYVANIISLGENLKL